MLHDRKPKFQSVSDMMSVAESSPALGTSRVGAELRAARLRLGWQLYEAAAALRIRLPFLEAIEAGRLSDLPGNAYAVGFVRSYAAMLGLDPAEAARRFRAESQDINRRTVLTFPAPVPERGVPAGAVVLLGLVIAAGSYAAWFQVSGRPAAPDAVPDVPERLMALAETPAPPPAASPPAALPIAAPPAAPSLAAADGPPAPAPPAEPAPAPAPAPALAAAAEPNRMVLRFKADSWVQVREKQGPVLLSRTMREGETWPVPNGQLLLTTGNAGGVDVVIDGGVQPALGAAGVVRRDIALNAEAGTLALPGSLTFGPASPGPASPGSTSRPPPR